MKNFLVIGMGEFGSRIAARLKSLKNDVFVVDSDYEKINLINGEYSGCLCADAMKPQVLRDLGIKSFEACIVTVGQNFQASLEITSRLKELGAQYVISKSYSDIQSKFLTMAGADETIYPEKDTAEKVAVTLNSKSLIDYVDISEDYGVYRIRVPKEWVGKTLIELDLRRKSGLNVLAYHVDTRVIPSEPTYRFNKDDDIYLFGQKAEIDRMIKKAR